MNLLLFFFTLLLAASQVKANVKGVFAHFMGSDTSMETCFILTSTQVSNTATYTQADWEDDFSKAISARIDAFVLNIAVNETTNGASLTTAFAAANAKQFKLFFSFDYAGNGLWPKEEVIAMIQRFSLNGAYYRRGSQMLVSTFEGPAASADWTDIKTRTGCYFIPSWSSLGAVPALAKGTADGLFSWAAWPTGPEDMTTFTDSSYLDVLGSKPFMMGVSPWFYSNMPGFRKNWLWRGDSLWFDRWINVMFLQPEYVQIITWNDFGESHHIGPLRDKSYEAFERGKSPFNYVLDKPHDGWRHFLPPLIELAKTNKTSITQEMLTAWYRQNPANSCGTGGTTGNTASQLQPLFAPGQLLEDKIFFAAFLGSSATVSVSVGGVSLPAKWTYIPSNGAGLYRGSVAYGGASGNVVVTVSRGGLTINGKPISSNCPNGLGNWNPNVEFVSGGIIAAKPMVSLDQSGCTSGIGNFKKYSVLCEFTCKYDYCPRGSCTCTSIGTPLPKPAAKNLFACPAEGIDQTYLGLCSFTCNYAAICPEQCKIYPANTVCVAPMPVAPPVPVCIKGMADGDYSELCSLSCFYGFCPPEICTCTEAGTSLPALPPSTLMTGSPKGKTDYGLCEWTCRRGNCPENLCNCVGAGCGSTSGGGGAPGTFFEGGNVAMSLLTSNLNAQTGASCHRQPNCAPQDRSIKIFPFVNHFGSCGNELKIGWDAAGCPKGWGKSICCAANSRFDEGACTWRGDGSECNGQCWPGEVGITRSSWGGNPTFGNHDQCWRGSKVLCCEAPDFEEVTRGCRWTSCGASCKPQSEVELIARRDGWCPGGSSLSRYCCPSPPLLYECKWRGTFWSSCTDNSCLPDEVSIATSYPGDAQTSCYWGRKKSACCKAAVPEPEKVDTCPDDVPNFCLLFPGFCDEEVEEMVINPAPPGTPSERSLGSSLSGVLETDFANGNTSLSIIEPRAGRLREFYYFFPDGKVMRNAYRSPQVDMLVVHMFNAGRATYFFLLAPACNSLEVISGSVLHSASELAITGVGWTVEHMVELAWNPAFMVNLGLAVLPNGMTSLFAPLAYTYIQNRLMSDTGLLENSIQISTTSPVGMQSGVMTMFEAWGSNTNIFNFIYLPADLNSVKGAFMNLKNMFQSLKPKKGASGTIDDVWPELVLAGLDSVADFAIWQHWLKLGFGFFALFSLDAFFERWEIQVKLIAAAMIKINGALPDSLNELFLGARWTEWVYAQMDAVQDHAITFLANMIKQAINIVELANPVGRAAQLLVLHTYQLQLPGLRLRGAPNKPFRNGGSPL